MNVASGRSVEDARRLRDWLVESDSAADPQAYVLRPDVVLRISEAIMQADTPYQRTRQAVLSAVNEIAQAYSHGAVQLADREVRWLKRYQQEAESLPENESQFIDEMLSAPEATKFIKEEYGL
jgi:methanol--5-hydroxybenzimidazolylcobamide Co-methyltransferase